MKELSIKDYTYNLPDDYIAKHPIAPREASKLLLYNSGHISETAFSKLPESLPGGSNLVINDTRVLHARLLFYKPTGARIEIFCLNPSQPPSYDQALSEKKECNWKCLIGNQKKWKTGKLQKEICINDHSFHLRAELIDTEDSIVRFSWDNPSYSFDQILEAFGSIPIPPYLNRESEKSDTTNYQTTYSKITGSVASPTAGLHFTPKILNQIRQEDTILTKLTLHVGAGTFRPILSHKIEEHLMHAEYFSIGIDQLEQLITHHRFIVSVGTTSLRSLESLYWLGFKISQGMVNNKDPLQLEQWEPYSYKSELSLKESLSILSEYIRSQGKDRLEASTSIMIVPGYSFRVIKALITNFHLPKSTLLLLIAALIGKDWKRVYDFALTNKFRFLSYGDSSLLIP